jgi:hypothetical protein
MLQHPPKIAVNPAVAQFEQPLKAALQAPLEQLPTPHRTDEQVPVSTTIIPPPPPPNALNGAYSKIPQVVFRIKIWSVAEGTLHNVGVFFMLRQLTKEVQFVSAQMFEPIIWTLLQPQV